MWIIRIHPLTEKKGGKGGENLTCEEKQSETALEVFLLQGDWLTR